MLLKYVPFFVCLLDTVSCASSSDDGREVSCSFSQVGDALLEEAITTPKISSHLSNPKPGSPEVTDSNNESKLSSDNDGNLIFNRIPPDIIRHISTFMEPKDVANWRNVNDLTIYSVPLKKTVEQTFNISGLDEIDDFEPELAYVMELVHTSHDHVLFFTALMEDVVGEKKPYVVLFCPLMLHLLRTYRQLSPRKLGYYEYNFKKRFGEFVEKYMAKICIRKGQLDLFCEITRDAVGIAGWAFRNAVKLGLAHFVEILLQHRRNINICDVGEALEYAAKNGHTQIVEILLQCRPHIPTHAVGMALINAAKNGHTQIVEIILQDCHDIPTGAVCRANNKACHYGHTPIVEILLQRRPDDFSADIVGYALSNAARNGHTQIVEIILQIWHDIPTFAFRMALSNAAMNGHTLIVEILLQDCHDIPAAAVCRAINKAVHYGHTPIVKILIQRRPDIPADDVDRALHDADYDGYTYQRRPDSPADDGGALDDAAQDSCTLIVELVSRYQMNMHI
jgi:hypothetical protein